MKPEDILTPEQLAERLQVGVNWVYEKSRNRGKHNGKPLPVLRCGRYLRFYWPDVCKWMRGGEKQQATTSRANALLTPRIFRRTVNRHDSKTRQTTETRNGTALKDSTAPSDESRIPQAVRCREESRVISFGVREKEAA